MTTSYVHICCSLWCRGVYGKTGCHPLKKSIRLNPMSKLKLAAILYSSCCLFTAWCIIWRMVKTPIFFPNLRQFDEKKRELWSVSGRDWHSNNLDYDYSIFFLIAVLVDLHYQTSSVSYSEYNHSLKGSWPQLTAGCAGVE
jgi:hypothetical protein